MSRNSIFSSVRFRIIILVNIYSVISTIFIEVGSNTFFFSYRRPNRFAIPSVSMKFSYTRPRESKFYFSWTILGFIRRKTLINSWYFLFTFIFYDRYFNISINLIIISISVYFKVFLEILNNLIRFIFHSFC
jgi:hypothetical protein